MYMYNLEIFTGTLHMYLFTHTHTRAHTHTHTHTCTRTHTHTHTHTHFHTPPRMHMYFLLQEEIELKKKLVESVQQCSAELAQLCGQLSLPVESPPDEWTLLAKEKHLRTRADTLTKVR